MSDDISEEVTEMGGVFICEDCFHQTLRMGPYDGLPVCFMCRYIRTVPDMSEALKAHLRGTDIQEVVELYGGKG